jgi:hypothetical protein
LRQRYICRHNRDQRCNDRDDGAQSNSSGFVEHVGQRAEPLKRSHGTRERDTQLVMFLTCLLSRNGGGIVRCMPLSRPQLEPGLFSAAADHEPDRGPADLISAQPSAAVVSAADKSSPRYVLPSNLFNALQQLDDTELDRLVAAARHELQRRGRPMISTPETHVSPGEGASKASITNDQLSKRQQLRQPNGTLTQGQRNAVFASFKAGIAPSRIARQFGLSQSDVLKVLALEPRKGR